MFKYIKKVPYWYLLAIPLLSVLLGVASNQAVLIANGDRFPVLVNNEKIHAACQTPDASAESSPLAILLGAPVKETPEIAQAPIDPNLCQNGGKFIDDTHVIMDKSSHLKILSDIIDLKDAVYSIGDGLLEFGAWMWGWAGIAWLVLVIRKFIEA